MRMRRKKNLDTRITSSSDFMIDLPILPLDVRKANEIRSYLDLEVIFGRRAPLHLEIGCGRGGFVVEMARLHPEVDFLAVEKISNVAVSAMEKVRDSGLTNVRIMITGAEYLSSYLPPHSIDRIYLNFSTPMMKRGYEVSRLTSPRLLSMYRGLLVDGGSIWQKTDNEPFFDFSLESYREVGYTLAKVTRDLHGEGGVEGDVMTEYERKFVSMGLPIYRVEAYIHHHHER